MATTVTTIGELRSMQLSDLRREVRTQRVLVTKLRLGIDLQKEKDTAKYKREKKILSRMMTVLSEKNSAGPSDSSVPSTPSKPVLKSAKSRATLPRPS